MDGLLMVVIAGLVVVARVAHQRAKKEITLIEWEYRHGSDMGEPTASE
jgi:hypothetical protein